MLLSMFIRIYGYEYAPIHEGRVHSSLCSSVFMVVEYHSYLGDDAHSYVWL